MKLRAAILALTLAGTGVALAPAPASAAIGTSKPCPAYDGWSGHSKNVWSTCAIKAIKSCPGNAVVTGQGVMHCDSHNF